jgi:hypothetical protein
VQTVIGKEQEIITRDALAIVGMPASRWRNGMDKGTYAAAPPLQDGRRLWDHNSLVALAWADSLYKAGMQQAMTGQLAAALLRAMAAHPRADVLNAYAWEQDAQAGGMSIGLKPPREAPYAAVIFVIPVNEWRAKVEAAIANFYERKAARRAR